MLDFKVLMQNKEMPAAKRVKPTVVDETVAVPAVEEESVVKQQDASSAPAVEVVSAKKQTTPSRYNELKKLAKVALSLSKECNPKTYADIAHVAGSDKDKLDKEIIGLVLVLQQMVPGSTQFNKEALLAMKSGTVRKTAKSLLNDLESNSSVVV